tara:strand:+ start:205 stop:747 length:543 start_codon:yes stop_codon:yes gene_type:complete
MSGIIGGAGSKSGVIGHPPSGSIFYTDSVEFTSTQATSDIGTSYDISSDLVISVPAATVNKCSKIWIAINNESFLNANVRGADWLAYFQWEIYRTAPSTAIIASYERCGNAQDTNDIEAAIGITQATITGWDKSLSNNAVHTYALRTAKMSNQAVYGGSSFTPHGNANSKVNISVFGVAK